MKSVARRAQRRFTLLLGLMAVLFAQPGQAIVGGMGADTSSFWSGVVMVGGASGVLIGPDYVLTAGHVGGGSNSNPSFSVTFDINGVQTSIAAESVSSFGFTGAKTGGMYNDDLTLIKLSSAAPSGATVYSLYTNTAAVTTSAYVQNGPQVTVVGFGNTGTGITGEISGAGVRRVGTNTINAIIDGATYTASPKNTVQSQIVEFDFDGTINQTVMGKWGGTAIRGEAQYGSGDSGSPMFIQVGDQWEVYGIASFNGSLCTVETVAGVCPTGMTYSSNNSSFGSIGGATSIAAFSSLITAQMAVMAVPEPQSYAMLLAGLGLLGVCVRRRSSSGGSCVGLA